MIFLIEGAFGESNFGDDLLLMATINAMRSNLDLVKVIVHARDVSVPGDYLDRLPFVDEVVRGMRVEYINYDMCVYAGGTQFYSYPSSSKYGRNRNGIKHLLVRVLRKVMRSFRRTRPSAFLGIGIGPFLDGNEDACMRLLSKSSYLAVRDRRSIEFLDKWGVLNKSMGADICFARKYWLPEIGVRVDRTIPCIGIVVRDFEYNLPGRDYLNSLLGFCTHLNKKKVAIKFFSFSKVKDGESLSTLVSHGLHVSVWDGEMSNFTSYVSEIAECTLLITARFHGVIVGAALGIPSIGIEVDPKVRLVCEEFGSACAIWSAPFDSSELVILYDNLISSSDDLRPELEKSYSKLEHESLKMLDSFYGFIEECNSCQ
jgi:polysaccharide pyruvyl transferase WcaK-like protein